MFALEALLPKIMLKPLIQYGQKGGFRRIPFHMHFDGPEHRWKKRPCLRNAIVGRAVTE